MRRRGRWALLMPGLLALGGCYTYSYQVPDRPAPGSMLDVALNDRGRVALEHNVGPEVLRIEGLLASASDSELVLRVSRVVGIDQSVQRWGGEQVAVRTEYVRAIRERRFHAGRTIALAGSVAAATIGFFATRSIFGLGNGTGDPTGPGNGDGDQ